MDIRNAQMIPDSRLIPALGVARPFGRKLLDELAAAGVIEPLYTASGRRLVSIRDAEKIAARL